MKKTLIVLFTSLFLVAGAFAQSILPNTTLSAAVTASGKQVIVASATGISAGVKLYVDRELMDVLAVSGTNLTVARGMGGTKATAHNSAAVVFAGQPQWFTTATPAGACARTNEVALPKINVITGTVSDCLGGQWVNGDAMQTSRPVDSSIPFPDPGATAYTSINTNGTTLAASTMYCTEISLAYNKLITGLSILNGTTVGTDNHLVVLYDSSGKLLANSAVAGVLAASASTYQSIAFTTPYYAVGPADYFGCVQTNGTAATVRMVITGTQDNILTKGVTGQTFGTIPASITVPTTFTTAVGPYLAVY